MIIAALRRTTDLQALLWCTTAFGALFRALRALLALSWVVWVLHVLHCFGVFTCFQRVVVFHVVEPQLHTCYCLFEIVVVTDHRGSINNHIPWYQRNAWTQRVIQLHFCPVDGVLIIHHHCGQVGFPDCFFKQNKKLGVVFFLRGRRRPECCFGGQPARQERNKQTPELTG